LFFNLLIPKNELIGKERLQVHLKNVEEELNLIPLDSCHSLCLKSNSVYQAKVKPLHHHMKDGTYGKRPSKSRFVFVAILDGSKAVSRPFKLVSHSKNFSESFEIRKERERTYSNKNSLPEPTKSTKKKTLKKQQQQPRKKRIQKQIELELDDEFDDVKQETDIKQEPTHVEIKKETEIEIKQEEINEKNTPAESSDLEEPNSDPFENEYTFPNPIDYFTQEIVNPIDYFAENPMDYLTGSSSLAPNDFDDYFTLQMDIPFQFSHKRSFETDENSFDIYQTKKIKKN